MSQAFLWPAVTAVLDDPAKFTCPDFPDVWIQEGAWTSGESRQNWHEKAPWHAIGCNMVQSSLANDIWRGHCPDVQGLVYQIILELIATILLIHRQREKVQLWSAIFGVSSIFWTCHGSRLFLNLAMANIWENKQKKHGILARARASSQNNWDKKIPTIELPSGNQTWQRKIPHLKVIGCLISWGTIWASNYHFFWSDPPKSIRVYESPGWHCMNP